MLVRKELLTIVLSVLANELSELLPWACLLPICAAAVLDKTKGQIWLWSSTQRLW